MLLPGVFLVQFFIQMGQHPHFGFNWIIKKNFPSNDFILFWGKEIYTEKKENLEFFNTSNYKWK